MIKKFTVSVAVVAALFTATVRLPAAPCFVTNTPGPKACEPGCCANKTCCATSQQRTGPASQPLAKSSADQQTFATILQTAVVVAYATSAAEAEFSYNAKSSAHSPAVFALICIRLI